MDPTNAACFSAITRSLTLARSLTLGLSAVEHLAGDAARGHGRRPARVEGQVRDHFADLIAGDAVAEGALEVPGELVAASEREQRGDRDEAAVALAETGPFPDVTIEHFFAELDELPRDGADLIAGGHAGRRICHVRTPPRAERRLVRRTRR